MRLCKLAAVAAFGLIGVLGAAGCGGAEGQSTAGGAGDANAQHAAPEAASKPGAAAQPDAKPAQQPVSAQERHIVRTARLTLRVEDVGAAAARARDVAEQFGGFVANERTEADTAGLTLRVASDRLDDALAALDDLGEVTHREQQAEDVTEQVVDVQARIANQRASVERVRALLDRATTVGEVVQIESELTARQAELESLEKRAAALAGRTELATIDVSLSRSDGPVAIDERGGFLGGLAAGWGAFVATVSVLLTGLGATLPFLVALGVPALLVLWLVRHRRAAARPAPPASATGS